MLRMTESSAWFWDAFSRFFVKSMTLAWLRWLAENVSEQYIQGHAYTHSVASPIKECKKSALPKVPVTNGGAFPLGVSIKTETTCISSLP